MTLRTRLALALVFAALCGGCAILFPGEGVLVLKDLAAGDRSSRLKTRTPQPLRQAVSYEIGGRDYQGDLYRPGEKALASLLLVPGAVAAGRHDPRLISFANTLARARFLVLIPDLVLVRSFELRPENVQGVKDAVTFLSETETTPRIGIAALSYAVGPAVLAALDPDIGPRVSFLVGIGGYYDLNDLLTYITTGCRRAGGQWRCGEPQPYARWVFLESNIHRLADPRDRRLLGAIANRRIDHPTASVASLAAGLSLEGRSVYGLLSNDDPRRVPELVRRLPAAIRSDLRALDLANKNLSELHARLILVHGESDPLIPPTQSEALAEAAPPGKAVMFRVAGLQHVDIDPGELDRAALLAAINALLAERASGKGQRR